MGKEKIKTKRRMTALKEIIDPTLAEFSVRLAAAVAQSGHRRFALAKRIQKETGIPAGTFVAHCRGDRIPKSTRLRQYAAKYAGILGVDPKFLLADMDALTINQLTQELDISTDNSTKISHIPIAVPKRGAAVSDMNSLPLPQQLVTDEAAFCYQIPDGDFGMVGEHYTLVPGTFVVCYPYPREDIQPGQMVLCQPKGFMRPTIRLLKAQAAVSMVKSYSLISPNPLFLPIDINAVKNCKILARVAFAVYRL